MPRDNLSGRKFGRLLVRAFVGYFSPGKAQWLCKCDCGQRVTVFGYNLKNGNTRSCGCYKIDRTKQSNSTHQQSRTRLYGVYRSMLGRCLNPANHRYSFYGARGIKVCRRWRGPQGFQNFAADMGERPAGARSLERRDNNGPYSPDNCHWATQKEQCRNQRSNRLVWYKGKKFCLAELCEIMHVPYPRTMARLLSGWSIKEAVEIPRYERR